MNYQIFLTIGGIVMIACIEKLMGDENPNQTNLQAVSTGVNEFSANLYKSIAEKFNENLISSPVSVAMVLSMASFGAGGETEEQMFSTLHSPCDKTITKNGYQSLIDTLNSVKKVNLTLANKIYTKTGFKVKSKFKKITTNYFRSEAQSLDFNKAISSSKIINDWCAAQTNNRIKNIVEPSDVKQAVMILVNAVYFKGNWKNKFDPKLTVSKPFFTGENSSTKVPMMQKTEKIIYGEIPELDAQFVELLYNSTNDDDSTGMIIILPNNIDGLKNTESHLNEINIEKIRKSGVSKLVKLSCPKFKIESTIDLEAILVELGMVDMFNSNANFSGITDQVPLQISKVLQKAFIEVNEKGSEAAAVTIVGVRITAVSSPPPRPIVFNVNRPFIYAIIHRATNTVLFQGHVKLPKA